MFCSVKNVQAAFAGGFRHPALRNVKCRLLFGLRAGVTGRSAPFHFFFQRANDDAAVFAEGNAVVLLHHAFQIEVDGVLLPGGNDNADVFVVNMFVFARPFFIPMDDLHDVGIVQAA